MPMSSFAARKGRLISSAGLPPGRMSTLKWPPLPWPNCGTGVERAAGTRRVKRQQYLQTVLASLPVVPYTEQTAYEHARIGAELESSGKMIGYYDLIVAATAVERGSEVATFNQRHFSQVKGLTVIEPK